MIKIYKVNELSWTLNDLVYNPCVKEFYFTDAMYVSTFVDLWNKFHKSVLHIENTEVNTWYDGKWCYKLEVTEITSDEINTVPSYIQDMLDIKMVSFGQWIEDTSDILKSNKIKHKPFPKAPVFDMLEQPFDKFMESQGYSKKTFFDELMYWVMDAANKTSDELYSMTICHNPENARVFTKLLANELESEEFSIKIILLEVNHLDKGQFLVMIDSDTEFKFTIPKMYLF